MIQDILLQSAQLNLVDALRRDPTVWPWQCSAWLHLMSEMLISTPRLECPSRRGPITSLPIGWQKQPPRDRQGEIGPPSPLFLTSTCN
ncbi:hypothetical protein LINPERPRIM_LOCUS17911 [Linum perenne]